MVNSDGNTVVLEAWVNRKLEFLQIFLKTVDLSMLDLDITNKEGLAFSAVRSQFDIEMMKLEMEKLNFEH